MIVNIIIMETFIKHEMDEKHPVKHLNVQNKGHIPKIGHNQDSV